MEELSLDNILTGEEIEGLFTSPESTQEVEENTPPESKEQEPETTEVDQIGRAHV